MATSVKCARCGADLASGARFCSTCGTASSPALDERRVVTVVFADLTGFTQISERMDPEQVKHVIDRATGRLGVVVERYGGTVDKVIGDEIMAVFGAPEAHEDDPERAVRCAFAMRAELEAMSSDPTMPALTMHIGINTGEVVAGTVGGRDYTILGDAVNTARRIQEAAEPGQILVGDSTKTQTEHSIGYRSLEALSVKGKMAPVLVHEAVTERGLPGRVTLLETPLVGRREEMHLITLAGMMAERDRRPRIVTIVGEAGMGKSKIASEVAIGAQRLNVGVISARSIPYATVSPGFVLEQLLRQVLDIEESDEPAAQVRAALADLDLSSEAEIILAFLGLQPEVAARSTGGAPGAGAVPTMRRSTQACARVIAHSARSHGLTVCIINDLQWAEDIVLDVLESLANQEDAPLLIVALARPSLMDEPPTYLSSSASLVLPLAPLASDRAAEILTALTPELPLATREQIIERAGGNPFFLEELARLARETPRSLSKAVPPTIQAVVAARLDRLPADEKRLLQLASITANVATVEALAAMHGHGIEDVSEIAGKLMNSGLLEITAPGTYRFAQKIVREVAYGSMPKQQRVQAHLSYGDWLLNQPNPRTDELAHTFECASSISVELGDDSTAATEHGRRALIELAMRALERDAATIACELFERALALGDAELPLPARIGYGEALLGTLRHEEAEENLRSALEEARLLGDRTNEGRALRLIGDGLRMRGRIDAAREPILEALSIAKKLGMPGDIIAAERSRGLLDLFSGDYREASSTFTEAIRRAEEIGDRRAQGWALQNLGWTLMVAGRQIDANDAFTQAEKLFSDLDDHEGRGWSMGMRAWSLLMMERLDESVSLMAEVDHLVNERFPGDQANLVMARRIVEILDCYVSIARADLSAAEIKSREILTEPEWHGLNWAHSLAAYPLALSALLQERPDTARGAIERGRAAARVADDPFYLGLYSIAAAWLAMMTGDTDQVQTELASLEDDKQAGRAWRRSSFMIWLRARIEGSVDGLRAASEAISNGAPSEGITVLPVSYLLADLAAALLPLDLDAARTAAIASRRGPNGFEVGRISSLLINARVHLVDGEHREAEEAVAEAIALLDPASYPLAEAQAHALLAEILDSRRDHDRADEAFERAKAFKLALPTDTRQEARDKLRL